MHFSKSGAFVGGVVFAVAVGGGTAVATNGASLLIGTGNVGTAATGLANSKGTPLSLAAKPGTPPLKVNSTVKVKGLNSDLLDGLDSTAYLDDVYTGQTTIDQFPRVPSLFREDFFDAVRLPAGTYSVALTTAVVNGDPVAGEFACGLAFADKTGIDYGLEGDTAVSPVVAPEETTVGSTAASQVITLPRETTAEAYCFARAGDPSHTAYVFNSTLVATRVQTLHGTASKFKVTPTTNNAKQAPRN